MEIKNLKRVFPIHEWIWASPVNHLTLGVKSKKREGIVWGEINTFIGFEEDN